MQMDKRMPDQKKHQKSSIDMSADTLAGLKQC